jgi:hypothetical protein
METRAINPSSFGRMAVIQLRHLKCIQFGPK